MEKALEILKEFKAQIESCPDDCWFELNQVNEAITELEAKDEADYKIGAWLSSALEDKNVCDEFKKDIEFWFSFQEIRTQNEVF